MLQLIMSKRIQARKAAYWYLIPVVALFAFGVLARTADRVNQTQLQQASAPACEALTQTGEFDWEGKLAMFEGRQVDVPVAQLAQNPPEEYVLGVASPSERWVEVDISEQKLKAWDGSTLFLETSISSGLAITPTPFGEYRVWMKIRATKMEGGQGRNYYNLPNVPYVMFFENDKVPGYLGYGLHGTYWHNDFGTRRSHGCVNLPTNIAEKLYYWTTPVLPEGKRMVRATAENPGTRIVIHE